MGYDMVNKILNMKRNRMKEQNHYDSYDGNYPYMGGRHMPPMAYNGMRMPDYAMNDNRQSSRNFMRDNRDRGQMPYNPEYDYGRGYDYGYEEDYGRRRRDSRGRYMSDRGGYDYGRNDYGGYDYGKEMMYLSEKDMMKWKQKLENADGTHGEHFKMDKVMSVAQKLGMRFQEYDEKDLCMVMNMLYSDFCEVNKPYISPDNEPVYYAKFAKAWLEDKDAPAPKEKLALYYYCIVDTEE